MHISRFCWVIWHGPFFENQHAKLTQIFIFTEIHILWRPTSPTMQCIHETWCALSSPKEIDAFWYPSHLSISKIGWSKWGKVTLLNPKQSLWFLFKIEVICCVLKRLLRVFSHRFIWSSKIFMRGVIWRALILLYDILTLSWNIWSFLGRFWADSSFIFIQKSSRTPQMPWAEPVPGGSTASTQL